MNWNERLSDILHAAGVIKMQCFVLNDLVKEHFFTENKKIPAAFTKTDKGKRAIFIGKEILWLITSTTNMFQNLGLCVG